MRICQPYGDDRCPHAGGGEPAEELAQAAEMAVVPTLVGVNR